MKCPQCGSPVAAEAAFCSSCGRPVTHETAEPAAATAVVESQVEAGSIWDGVPAETPVSRDGADGDSNNPAAEALDRVGSAITGFGKKMADKRRQRKEEEERVAAERAAQHARIRQAAYEQASQTCPIPIQLEAVDLPGGLKLFDDEFVVIATKDWGITTKKMIITTHRLIHAKGTFVKDQEIVNLTDVQDVNFHKTMLLPGDLEIETAGGHSITGLPFARKSKELRNQLLELVNWAKNRKNMPQVVMAASAPVAAPAAPDKFEQLQKLAELRSSGVLTDEEFAREKAKLLET